jgi:hypothetical protein
MKMKPQSIIQPLLMYGFIVLLVACNTPPSSESGVEANGSVSDDEKKASLESIDRRTQRFACDSRITAGNDLTT